MTYIVDRCQFSLVESTADLYKGPEAGWSPLPSERVETTRKDSGLIMTILKAKRINTVLSYFALVSHISQSDANTWMEANSVILSVNCSDYQNHIRQICF